MIEASEHAPSRSGGTEQRPNPVPATGELALFSPGDRVRIARRSPIGHYRVPIYLRGQTGVVEKVIPALGVNNEEEGFGRNAGQKRHYYRIVLQMAELWPDYPRASRDTLHIEVFETWLETIAP